MIGDHEIVEPDQRNIFRDTESMALECGNHYQGHGKVTAENCCRHIVAK